MRASDPASRDGDWGGGLWLPLVQVTGTSSVIASADVGMDREEGNQEKKRKEKKKKFVAKISPPGGVVGGAERTGVRNDAKAGACLERKLP